MTNLGPEDNQPILEEPTATNPSEHRPCGTRTRAQGGQEIRSQRESQITTVASSCFSLSNEHRPPGRGQNGYQAFSRRPFVSLCIL